MTLLHRNSKADTALLLDRDAATITTDLGPERTNLTNVTTYLEEDPSPRAAIDAPRNITIVATMQTGWGGTLIELGNNATYSWRLSVSGDEVFAAEGGLLRVRLPVPGLTDSKVRVVVHWSQHTQGVIVFSELAIYNDATGQWAFATASHSAATPDPDDTLTIGASFGGGSPYSGEADAVLAVHLGRRFHSTTEARQDWVAESTPAAFTGFDRSPALTAAAADLVIAGEGEFAGPSFLMAGAATRQAGQRAVGHFINLDIREPHVELLAPDPVRWYRPTPSGADGWQWCVRYLWHGLLSPKVNVAAVRIHVRAAEVTGGSTISPVRFRAFSIADLPLNGGPDKAMTYYRGPIVSVTSPSSAGVWVELGTVRLARDAEGLSYFALGFLIDADEDEGVLHNTSWKLNAITVTPFAKDLSGGGFGGDMDKEAP